MTPSFLLNYIWTHHKRRVGENYAGWPDGDYDSELVQNCHLCKEQIEGMCHHKICCQEAGWGIEGQKDEQGDEGLGNEQFGASNFSVLSSYLDSQIEWSSQNWCAINVVLEAYKKNYLNRLSHQYIQFEGDENRRETFVYLTINNSLVFRKSQRNNFQWSVWFRRIWIRKKISKAISNPMLTPDKNSVRDH